MAVEARTGDSPRRAAARACDSPRRAEPALVWSAPPSRCHCTTCTCVCMHCSWVLATKLRPHARDCVQAGVSVVPQHEYLSIRAAAIVPHLTPSLLRFSSLPAGFAAISGCAGVYMARRRPLRHLAPPPTRTRAPSPALATRLHGTERILRALVPCLEPTVYLMQSFPTSLCLPLRARRPPPRAPARHPFCAATP